jgi:hypothetical protein
MGADLGYIGSPFIATEEANATPEYKQGIVDGRADDVVYSSLFTGVHGNYLKASIVAAGLDPANLPEGDISTMDFATGASKSKAWRDIWGSGQGISAIHEVRPAGDYVAALIREYEEAKAALRAKWGFRSSPGFLGEGDRVKRGGGVLSESEDPLHQPAAGPPPLQMQGRIRGASPTARSGRLRDRRPRRKR